MSKEVAAQAGRRLVGGKIIFNFGQSVIDCVVRRMTADGASIDVQSAIGIPTEFNLVVAGEQGARRSKVLWQSDKQLGVAFLRSESADTIVIDLVGVQEKRADPVRSHMLALRASLDLIEVGVVLLDNSLRAQFLNRAFRRMWQLSDQKADCHPTFLSLLKHGREINAYQVEHESLDLYIEERIALVQSGDSTPLDLRRTNGDVLRMQVAPLPDGGRLISYTEVTDLVRHADELEFLRQSLDKVDEGIAILDSDLRACFLNERVRKFWDLSEEAADKRPSLLDLMRSGARSATNGMAPEKREAFFSKRIAQIKAGDGNPVDLQMTDGRHLRARCTRLPNDRRMLTYSDITDLVQNTKQLERLATIDDMTGLYNRRHFLRLAQAEWSRLRRYKRSLSLLVIDIDFFKAINDRYGHAAGDETIRLIAARLLDGRRGSDIVGRLGGEEFAVLLPETDLDRAALVAERIRDGVASLDLSFCQAHFKTSVSIGIAPAEREMSALTILLKTADDALYSAKSKGRNRWEVGALGGLCHTEIKALEIDCPAIRVGPPTELDIA